MRRGRPGAALAGRGQHRAPRRRGCTRKSWSSARPPPASCSCWSRTTPDASDEPRVFRLSPGRRRALAGGVQPGALAGLHAGPRAAAVRARRRVPAGGLRGGRRGADARLRRPPGRAGAEEGPAVRRCTTTSWGWPTGGWDGTQLARASFAAAAALDPPNPWPWFDLGRSERAAGPDAPGGGRVRMCRRGGQRRRARALPGLVGAARCSRRETGPWPSKLLEQARLSHPALGDELTRAAQAGGGSGRGSRRRGPDRAARTRRNWRRWSTRACRPGGSCRCCARTHPWSRRPPCATPGPRTGRSKPPRQASAKPAGEEARAATGQGGLQRPAKQRKRQEALRRMRRPARRPAARAGTLPLPSPAAQARANNPLGPLLVFDQPYRVPRPH